MALDPEDIRLLLERPDSVEPDLRNECTYRKRGRIAAVVDPATNTVLTLLRRTEKGNKERWDRNDIEWSRD